MSWQESGAAWGSNATDWAFLMEPYARAANDRLFELLPVGRGSRLLDVACGSGYACWVAAERGATVTGLDAAPNLIRIAKERHPSGDFRVGDMFSLPFGDNMFDVVTSFNGIWAGCDGAVAEALRVLRPGGRFGMTFWGNPKRLGLYPYFATVAALSPPEHRDATIRQGTTGAHGIAEAMLQQAGFTDAERGVVTVWAEWPDVPTAVRALTAAGPSRPAIEKAGAQRFTEQLSAALQPHHRPGIGIRLPNEFGYLIATAP